MFCFLVTFILLSSNVSKLDWSNILSFGKDLSEGY